MREQFTRVRVFAFVDELDEVTDLLAPGVDVLDAVAQLDQLARVRGWYGRTDYGRAFDLFDRRFADAVTPRTALLVLGDARSNYGDPNVAALRRIAHRARRAHWLNPERRTGVGHRRFVCVRGVGGRADDRVPQSGPARGVRARARVRCAVPAQHLSGGTLRNRATVVCIGPHRPSNANDQGSPCTSDCTSPISPGRTDRAISRRISPAIAQTAEDVGFTKLSVMDHVWQIHVMGPPEHEMLEAYTTLGYLAAQTKSIELLAWVTAVVYRAPGLLAKEVTTLDVLSGGRAWLGIGAAWNEEEARGLGLDFPPTAERFERLEEALQIFIQMCSDDDGPYRGKHYTLERTLNSPQSIQRPHPPILIGGGGERKTLRMVAQYAQACNLFGGPELERKLDILRQHCADVGRDYDEIEKTVMRPLELGPNGEGVDELLADLKGLSELGVTHVHSRVQNVQRITPLEILGERVIPVVADF